jgi:hypothetical protein
LNKLANPFALFACPEGAWRELCETAGVRMTLAARTSLPLACIHSEGNEGAQQTESLCHALRPRFQDQAASESRTPACGFSPSRPLSMQRICTAQDRVRASPRVSTRKKEKGHPGFTPGGLFTTLPGDGSALLAEQQRKPRNKRSAEPAPSFPRRANGVGLESGMMPIALPWANVNFTGLSPGSRPSGLFVKAWRELSSRVSAALWARFASPRCSYATGRGSR